MTPPLAGASTLPLQSMDAPEILLGPKIGPESGPEVGSEAYQP